MISSTDARFSFALASRLMWACMVVFMVTPFLGGCSITARDVNITPEEEKVNEEKTEDEPPFFEEVVFEGSAKGASQEWYGHPSDCAWRN